MLLILSHHNWHFIIKNCLIKPPQKDQIIVPLIPIPPEPVDLLLEKTDYWALRKDYFAEKINWRQVLISGGPKLINQQKRARVWVENAGPDSRVWWKVWEASARYREKDAAVVQKGTLELL